MPYVITAGIVLAASILLGGSNPPTPPTIRTPELDVYAICRTDDSSIPYWRHSEKGNHKVLTQKLQCWEA